ncbi:hypothetical protein I2I11_04105 [Pontibacter sp. 172403-2]|uniref:hypothetical protein n=1 Tax=Pontibacter rufus TaxID=2791028 RepID=UPI0018B0079F|nr:hypothetical protein [Pontibacter sp. 172403-2]MBF9252467.1 hypothetical protein [Pontibacter sp. 172403-2]
MKEKLTNLQPGQELNTLAGPATFLKFQKGNFHDQNYQVQFHNGKTAWYSADQLKEANMPDSVRAQEELL